MNPQQRAEPAPHKQLALRKVLLLLLLPCLLAALFCLLVLPHSHWEPAVTRRLWRVHLLHNSL